MTILRIVSNLLKRGNFFCGTTAITYAAFVFAAVPPTYYTFLTDSNAKSIEFYSLNFRNFFQRLAPNAKPNIVLDYLEMNFIRFTTNIMNYFPKRIKSKLEDMIFNKLNIPESVPWYSCLLINKKK